MTPDALRTEQQRLGLSQGGLARLLDVDDRTVRRWLAEDVPIPRAVELALAKLSRKEAASLQRR